MYTKNPILQTLRSPATSHYISSHPLQSILPSTIQIEQPHWRPHKTSSLHPRLHNNGNLSTFEASQASTASSTTRSRAWRAMAAATSPLARSMVLMGRPLAGEASDSVTSAACKQQKLSSR